MLPDIAALVKCLRLVWKFRGYKPKPVTVRGLTEWINQFEKKDRAVIFNILESVEYLTERDIKRALVHQNESLLKELDSSGIPPKNIIYVSIDKAGSSSAVMLNILRDACHLERRGYQLLDSHDVLGISKVSGEIDQGAIIYVDDFSASGGQFCSSRDFVASNLIGNQFAEFFLVPCICEEAIYKLAEREVEARAEHIHAKAVRPLHDQGNLLDNDHKARVRQMCLEIDRKGGLGYGSLATNVVLYRNSPNTMPVILRGNKGQERWVGVFPRTDDLPVPKRMAVN